jgi:hypothetical protein
MIMICFSESQPSMSGTLVRADNLMSSRSNTALNVSAKLA